MFYMILVPSLNSHRNAKFFLLGTVGYLLLSLVGLTVGLFEPQYVDAALEDERIVFSGKRPGDSFQIYVTDVDGSNPDQLTHTSEDNLSPAWSPDGEKIAFIRDQQIWTMYWNGTNLKQITSDGESDSPAWSPDGEKIAFSSSRDGDWEIFVMDEDGSGLEQLTFDNSRDWDPTWSPNGNQIAFTSFRLPGTDDPEIFLVDVENTGNVAQLTDSPGDNMDPDWSPDGTKIAFESSRDGDWEIFVMDVGADDTDATQLTFHDSRDYDPAWSPDGTRIAFTSYRDSGQGDPEIFIMDVNGDLSPAQVTDTSGQNLSPDWIELSDDTESGTDNGAGNTGNTGSGTVSINDGITVGDDTDTDEDIMPVDTTSPNTSIGDRPASPSKTSSATFSFMSTEQDSTFECRIDGGNYAECTSPYTIALGQSSHSFEVRAVDEEGNVDSSPASYAWIIDTTPPAISVPASMTVEASSSAGKTLTFSASVTDNLDGSLSPACSRDSGDVFAFGDSTVTCSATDTAGNTSEDSFIVTVVDTTPPRITTQGDIAVNASQSGPVHYSVSATDSVDGATAVSCSPASGSNFPMGTTQVSCTSADSRGNNASSVFSISLSQPDNPGSGTTGATVDIWQDRYFILTLALIAAIVIIASVAIYSLRKRHHHKR
jgi:Tol biopolymer transport system component